MHQELNTPSTEFVKLLAKQVYSSVITAKVLEQFTNLTKKSVQQYINDLITERLKTALSKEDEVAKEIDSKVVIQKVPEHKIETTEEELEAFMILKSILRQKVDIKRITFRDAQSYFSVLLDDNNRKPICRLYFNGIKKYLATINEEKKEVKNEIKSLDDIFTYTDLLFSVIASLEKGK